MTDYTVVDNFLDDPHSVRYKALRASYSDRVLQDGQLYKRISETHIPEVVDALNRHMGRPISLLGMAFRLNYEGEPPNIDVHSDMGWGKYALVLYLSEDARWQEGGDIRGTAFHTHIPSGADRLRPGDDATFKAVKPDWNNPEAWQLDAVAEGRFNRAVIYRSELFHSRWPIEAFGTTPQDGRLTLVAFFS